MTGRRRPKQASDIKVAVVGYGGAFNMGRQHLREMEAAGMTPCAVVELDPARLAVAREDDPGIETYPELGEMLERSAAGLVTIITPHDTHARLALQCLRAGRHVVCEKPLAITTAEVDAMIRAAHRRRVMLSTYHNRHWDGNIMQAVELVKKRRVLGEIVRIECHMGTFAQPGDWWRSSRKISGGILYDWGVHLLEYALQLIDAPLVEVAGFGHHGFWAARSKWKDDTIEDEAFAVVRFESGQWLTLGMSQIDAKGKDGILEITGTMGTLVLDHNHSTLHQRDTDGRITVTQMPNPPSEWHRYYENVRDHLLQGSPLVITAEWARRPIHILDLAVKSAAAGRALRVRYP